MKKLIRYIIIAIFLINYKAGMAQYPCVNTNNGYPITTNPDSITEQQANHPGWYNTCEDFKVNKFDWRSQYWYCGISPGYVTRSISTPNPSPVQIPSFFWSSNTYPFYTYYELDALSNFNPLNGWELIKQDFGYFDYNDNGSPPAYSYNNSTRDGPYVILYNKYTSTMRVIFAIDNEEAYTNYKVTVSFIDPSAPSPPANTSSFKFSGLLSMDTAVALPLDQNTTMKTVSELVASQTNADNFMFADFQVAYDPCTCINPSGIIVSFSTLSTSTINLYGRLLGLSENVAGMSGSNVLVNTSNSYLSSVWGHGTNVDGGMKVGQHYDSIINEYAKIITKQTAAGAIATQQATDEKQALTDVGQLFSVTGTILGIVAGTPASAPITLMSKVISGLGSFTNFLSSTITVPGSPVNDAKYPSIINADLALTGSSTLNVALNSDDISLATPGSYGADQQPEYWNTYYNTATCTSNPYSFSTLPPVMYPEYNEVLGTFALLQTPRVEHYRDTVLLNAGDDEDDWFTDPNPIGGVIYSSQYQANYYNNYQLELPLKYAFNPAAPIDKDSTTIYASIIFKIPPGAYNLLGPSGVGPYSYIGYGATFPNLMYAYEYNDTVVYMTPFINLACMGNMIPGFNYSLLTPGGGISPDPNPQPKIFLRLAVDMHFLQKSSTGAENHSLLIVTYPVNADYSETDLTTLPNYQNLQAHLMIPTTNYTSATTVQAWDSITITGNLTSSVTAPNSIIIQAPVTVQVQPGGSVGPGITLKTGGPGDCGQGVWPVSNDSIASYCSSTNYAASQAASSPPPLPKPGDSLINKPQIAFILYPNPAKDNVTIGYTLPESGPVNITLTDIYGRPVAVIQDLTYVQQGDNVLTYDVSRLSAGIYSCTLRTGDNLVTKRLVILGK